MGTPQGLILAGMQSSSGKTAITCLLLAALRKRGLAVQPFKVGPDFIDPEYHRRFAGVPCLNLDAWMMKPTQILQTIQEFGAEKISIIEGVMGLFDGASPTSNEGSTLELAQQLQWPILLVVPCQKAGRSLGAAIRGFVEQAKPAKIAGIILNFLHSESHAVYLKEALHDLALPIVGSLTQTASLHWTERHLGLPAPAEMQLLSWQEMATLGEQFLDIPKLLSWVASAPASECPPRINNPSLKIALAQDEAFHFYYHANLEYLKNLGIELVEFSPLRDQSLPKDIQGLLFGGGFPEVFAAQLAENEAMRRSICQEIQNGMPCYAECGGLMLLTQEIITLTGRKYPMVGIIPGAIQMTDSLQNFGYTRCHHPAFSHDPPLRGHEFHYSHWTAESSQANLWKVAKKFRGTTRQEGFATEQLHASYVHLYFPASSPLFYRLFGLV